MESNDNQITDEAADLTSIDTMSSTTVPSTPQTAPSVVKKSNRKLTVIVILFVTVAVFAALVAVYYLNFQPKKTTLSVVETKNIPSVVELPTALVEKTLTTEIETDQSSADTQANSETSKIEDVNLDAANLAGAYDENSY